MKRLVSLLLAALLLLGLAACSDSKTEPTGTKAPTVTDSTDVEIAPRTSKTLPTVLNQTEYVLYQNIFFNGAADDYVGKTAVKEGTFARIYDAFSQKYRYYVWGYMDATKCCDWQWEFVPADPDSLPPIGSLVKLTGTLTRDEAALDKLWFTDTTVEVKQIYEPAACDVNMTTMNATLERVQLMNMQYRPAAFAGKTLRIYGRVLNPTTIQHPYYDNAWTQPFSTQASVPANGTMVILTGTWQGDTIQAQTVEGTADY